MSIPIIQRSPSQDRRLLHSTGRGGAGNMHTPSPDRVEGPGPEDVSVTRGRDLVPPGDPDMVISTGRGGRGNIRSPSREPSRPGRGAGAGSVSPSPVRSELRGRQRYDEDLISAIDIERDIGVHSTGRGGSGNMVRSRPSSVSRSRSREPGQGDGVLGVHSTGRGGLGNIQIVEPSEKDIMEADETERTAVPHPPGMHSTGRGGMANLTPEVPNPEGSVHPHGADHPHATHTHDYESTGRGGTGNISRDRSREPGERNTRVMA